jgi:hypothetical protein
MRLPNNFRTTIHVLLGAMLALPLAPINAEAVAPVAAATAQTAAGPIKDRNVDAPRTQAAPSPRNEAGQAIVDGWPLYRTPRGQAAFNDTMATLRATEMPIPDAMPFRECRLLACKLALPGIGPDGWLPAGRIWISPKDYILLVHSPRLQEGDRYRRRSANSMRYFVFHEFQNSSNNTDPFDTISSHSGSVFVPLYMSKQRVDAYGMRFVAVIQVAPYDVVSVHAMNKGSAGPGMEVAKNTAEPLDPLQAAAGIVVANMITAATPRLAVVNHRGTEGLPMLQVYQRWLALARRRTGATPVTLPFVPAQPKSVATASADLSALILKPGAKLRIAHIAPSPAPAKLAANAPVPRPVEVYTLIEPVRLAVRPPCAKSATASCRTFGPAP